MTCYIDHHKIVKGVDPENQKWSLETDLHSNSLRWKFLLSSSDLVDVLNDFMCKSIKQAMQ